ncbi:MAG: AmmeMemoRadiSam system protein A [Candidatus Pacebacteria bacterium]|nr:AmmeMemoRadiSam system protein A [Candidatus Paceibacterota bacterium]
MPLLGTFIVPHPPLIVPEIGKGQELRIQKTIDAYKEIARRIGLLKPETIIVTTPHSILYADYFHLSPGPQGEGSFGDFGAPQVRMALDYDEELVRSISALAEKAGISAGTRGERNRNLDHGTMVPLYFINQAYNDFKLVRISLSGFSPLVHYQLGKCIAQAIEQTNKKVVIVASGDLSHKLKKDGPYGLSKEGPIFDREVTEAMASGNFLKFMTFEESFCESAAECGLRSFTIMAGALDGKKVKPELLSYEGPFGVGYAVAAFETIGDDETRHFEVQYENKENEKIESSKAAEDPFVRLARKSLEHFVKHQERINRPSGLPDELTKKRAGVFVSLKMEGRLRGCIGTILPTTACIADEIIQNAVSSGTEDYRFSPVLEKELPRLVYSVDVLGDPEPISSQKELDPKRYGVIVSLRGRRGLLLPNLEGIDTPEQQVKIALQKAGISAHEPYSMERFEVKRHK